MAAPVGMALGLGAAVTGAVVDPLPWTPAGLAIAGTAGLVGEWRTRVRRRRRAAARRDRRARLLLEPLPALVWESPAFEASAPTIDLRIDTGELQRIWDSGDGPDTGPLPAVPDAPVVVDGQLVTEAPQGKQAVLLTGVDGAGCTQVLAPVLTRRPRAGTTEARVYDALARAEADELTRTLEMPSGRGRHAAPAPLDGLALALPPGPSAYGPNAYGPNAYGPSAAAAVSGPQLAVVRRRGRHAA